MSIILGIARYNSDYKTSVDNTLTHARKSAQPIVDLMKQSLGGGNYKYVLNTSALERYRSTSDLLRMVATGKTDLGNNDFGIVYDSRIDEVLRISYPENYENSLQEKIKEAVKTIAEISTSTDEEDVELIPQIQEIKDQASTKLSGLSNKKKKVTDVLSRYSRPPKEKLEKNHYIDTRNYLIYLYIPVENNGGGEIEFIIDASSLNGLWLRVLQSMLPVTLISLVMAIVFSLKMSKSVIKPMKVILHTINDINQNLDLTKRVNLPAKGQYKETIEAFNQLFDKLQASFSEVTTVAETLVKSSVALTQITEDENSRIQKKQQISSEAATAMHEMSATIQEISKNAVTVATTAGQTDDKAREGNTIMLETATAINSLANGVEEASTTIQKLETETVSIGTVIDVIRDIAEQTNLLALNAAIEAARAGEQGRGFAVVADEVRTLANRTQGSTNQIQTMINNLQTAAQNATLVMTGEQEKAKTSVDMTTHAGETLQFITESVSKINDMNTQIASATEEQTTVAEQVSQNIAYISEEADKSVESAKEIESCSSRLNELASDLNKLVNQFKV